MTKRGSGPKPAKSLDEIDVVYSETHWNLLAKFRDRAVRIMKGLGTFETLSFVHGSLARGDVDEKSDIDILIPTNVNTQMVESNLELSGFEPTSREIVQAADDPAEDRRRSRFADRAGGSDRRSRCRYRSNRRRSAATP